jgi:hypothetical protein
LASAVRAGVICTSDADSASTTAVMPSSAQIARRSGNGRDAATRLRTRRREYAATAITTENSTILTMITRPYVVPNSADTVLTSINAWMVPARNRPATASAAHRDHTGRIAPSSRSSACGSRNPTSMTSPPSHTAIPARWVASTTTETDGTGEALGCPDSGQVARPTMARIASSARSAVPPRPDSTGRSRKAPAISTARRTRWVVPNWLASTSRVAPASK